MKKLTVILLLILLLLAGCRKTENYYPAESSYEEFTVEESYPQTAISTVSVPVESTPSQSVSTSAVSKTESSAPEKSQATASMQSSSEAVASKVTTAVKPALEEAGISNGVWLSYMEIRDLLKNPATFKNDFAAVLENCKTLRITNLYIHVHSHCDSIFESQYYPLTKEAQSYDYDIFEYMIKQCKKANIKVHAWINPYRVSATTEDVKTLPKTNPAYKWLNDDKSENDRNVMFFNGIYLNPTEPDVRTLVINGIREIIKKYDVNGIHFDDYFYPSTKASLDIESYEAYLGTVENPLKLSDWRRANVDILISDCKTAIKALNKKVIFSISPAASVEKNYKTYYADVAGWIEKGYIDEIIPQLYFGFNHTEDEFCFDNLLETWKKLCLKNKNVKLSIGLAAYKIGTKSKSDGTEWETNTDLLARQKQLCFDTDGVDGIVYFSYSSLFSNKKSNTAERNNLIKIINDK